MSERERERERKREREKDRERRGVGGDSHLAQSQMYRDGRKEIRRE